VAFVVKVVAVGEGDIKFEGRAFFANADSPRIKAKGRRIKIIKNFQFIRLLFNNFIF
jgi:hypothetical protein